MRIAIVDEDEETGRVAWQMVQPPGGRWRLEIYGPCRPDPRGLPHPERRRGKGCPACPPHIVLIGVSGHEPARLACVRRIKALTPNLPVLILSLDSDELSIVEGCAAGAEGYLLKPLDPGELARGIASAVEGQPALCPGAQKVLLNLLHRAATATTTWVPGLTRREQEVVACLLAAGHRGKEICERLGITPDTLHAHLGHIYPKLGVHSRKELAAMLLGVWRGGGGRLTHFSPFSLLAWPASGGVITIAVYGVEMFSAFAGHHAITREACAIGGDRRSRTRSGRGRLPASILRPARLQNLSTDARVI